MYHPRNETPSPAMLRRARKLSPRLLASIRRQHADAGHELLTPFRVGANGLLAVADCLDCGQRVAVASLVPARRSVKPIVVELVNDSPACVA